MSLGMNAAWRGMQPKQKRCERCELYTPKKLNAINGVRNIDTLIIDSNLLDQDLID